VSILNQRFKNHLDHHGLQNVGSIQTPVMADSPRRLHQIQSPQKLKNLYCWVCLKTFLVIY